MDNFNTFMDSDFYKDIVWPLLVIVGLVSAARKLPAARVNEIAQGRVWDGGTARQLGLVDAFGSLDDAVADAAKRAKIDAGAVSLVYLEQQPSWWMRWASDWNRPDDGGEQGGVDLLSMLAAKQAALAWSAIADARALTRGASIQARCLECGAVAPARPIDMSLGAWLAAILLK